MIRLALCLLAGLALWCLVAGASIAMLYCAGYGVDEIEYCSGWERRDK